MAEIRTLTAADELEPLLAASRAHPVWVFKHSLTCGTSSRALEQYRRFAAGRPDDGSVDLTLVEVQPSRPLSRALAERTGVCHQSPQALLLRDGAVVWSASHWSIEADALAAAEAETAAAGDTRAVAESPPAAGR